ncbi:MAG TPA: ATP-binding protein [Longimicrobiales bacterium]|nr:ATP-binding protein [Longimicrobiales bacterium]
MSTETSDRDEEARRVLETISDGLLALDPAGTVRDLNAAAARLLGTSAEALRGRVIWDEVPELAVQGLPARVEGDGGGEAPGDDLEIPLAREGRWLAITVYPADAGATLLLRDITDRRRAQEALRFSEAKFYGIAAIASEAIISIDEEERIIFFNEGAERIFGWPASEVLGRPLDILLPARYREVHHLHLGEFASSKVSARRMGERRAISGVRRSGVEFPAEASISKLDLDGRRIYTVVLRDVTDRRRAEEAQRFLARAGALLASSLDYEATLSSVARLAVSSLADWCVVYIREEGGPTRRLEVAHADPAKEALVRELKRFPLTGGGPTPARLAMETGEAQLVPDVSEELIRQMGQDHVHERLLRELGMASLVVAPLVGSAGTVGALGFYSASPARRYDEDDLALAEELARRAALAVENARLYQEARQAIKARDEVLSVVSHDVGNPLAAIFVGTRLLRRMLTARDETDPALGPVEMLRKSAEQIQRLISDLMEIQRIESGHLGLERRSQPPERLLERAMELMAPLAEEKGVRLEVDAEPALRPVLADRDRMLQVFSNLIGNALKFTPEGGRVRASARSGDGEVVFEVEDTGCGIAREELPHIFERFYQVGRKSRQGAGLGLAITKGIVEGHGGTISVASEPDVGTTFTFTIPSNGAAAE